MGSLQALILRPAAQGLGLWIGCCALAGALFFLIVPAVLYGPQSGIAQELVLELVSLVVTILAAGDSVARGAAAAAAVSAFIWLLRPGPSH